jgi:co-chaperonin GroES (HSP10)
MSAVPFADLNVLAAHLRMELATKKFILLYAYNGTGKTRLSTAFKDLGKKPVTRSLTTEVGASLETEEGEQIEVEVKQGDTLYFNAFTEDLFSWDNDLDGDSERYLILHPSSRFLVGLAGVDMDTKVYNILKLYADFEFYFDDLPVSNENGKFIRNERIVRFSRDTQTDAGSFKVENIKISRGEENIFVWCFFLAVLQMVLDGDVSYSWVKYIYIDDPISSLDEHNAIAVANHLAQMLTKIEKPIPTVISSHHVLFFNVLCNGLKKKSSKHLKNDETSRGYLLLDTTSKPFLHHLTTLVDLNDVKESGDVKRHHFNMMRCIMEQTAIFCGLDHWTACIKVADNDPDKALHERMINVMSHADYLINEPDELNVRYKDDFRKIFRKFINSYPFNPALFTAPVARP